MINIIFQVESHYQVNRDQVRQAIVDALSKIIVSDAEICISIVGDRQMKRLNRTYRQIDETTDVLSFPLNDSSQANIPFVDPPDKILRLGDIVISYPQAVKDASETDRLVDDMIVTLCLHGLNHLIGIHHPE